MGFSHGLKVRGLSCLSGLWGLSFLTRDGICVPVQGRILTIGPPGSPGKFYLLVDNWNRWDKEVNRMEAGSGERRGKGKTCRNGWRKRGSQRQGKIRGHKAWEGNPHSTSWMSLLNKRLVCFDLHQELLKRVLLTGQVRPIIFSALSFSLFKKGCLNLWLFLKLMLANTYIRVT